MRLPTTRRQPADWNKTAAGDRQPTPPRVVRGGDRVPAGRMRKWGWLPPRVAAGAEARATAPTPRNANNKGAMKQIGTSALDVGCGSVGGMRWRLESTNTASLAGLDTHADSASRTRKEDWKKTTDSVIGADAAARTRKVAGRSNKEKVEKEAPNRKAGITGPRMYTPDHEH